MFGRSKKKQPINPLPQQPANASGPGRPGGDTSNANEKSDDND
jgi:hypothetical protein